MREPTRSEREVLILLAEGLTNKEIAERRHTSQHTAKFHVQRLQNSWECNNRTQVVVMALKAGYLRLEEIP
jgi:NarL family two-component system response regulator LiaR